MGWCSGTEIFDEMVAVIKGNSKKREIIKQLIIILQDHDWDCESDSVYWRDPEVHEIFKELHPNWFDDENVNNEVE